MSQRPRPPLLLLFLLACLVHAVSSEVRLIMPPQSRRPRLGQSVTLACSFSPSASLLTWTFRGSGEKHFANLVWCSMTRGGSYKCVVEGAFADYTEVEGMKDGFLRLKGVKRRNNGQYQCSGFVSALNERAKSKAADVTVLVPPGRTQVTASRTDIREGEAVTLTCSSEGGNPRPDLFFWRERRPGAPTAGPLPPAGAPTQREVFAATKSELKIVVSADDDQARVFCRARNEVGVTNSTGYVLQVKYKPRIAAFTFDPLRVIERQQLVVRCSATGNPTPEISWNLGSRGMSASAKLSFPVISRNQAGVYTCLARNAEATVMRNLTIEVHYPPIIMNPKTYPVVEFDVVGLPCRVSAYPPAKIHWRRTDPLKTWSSSALSIERITRKQAGIYTCVATNTLRPSGRPAEEKLAENRTQVIVQYPPAQPKVEVSPGLTVIVGDPVTLSCSPHAADPGVPSPTFEWTNKRTGEVVSRQPDFQIARVSLADNSEFSCLARNNFGRGGPVPIVLNVDERPRLLEPLIPSALKVRIDQADSLQLKCVARGKPAPKIVWMKDNIPIDSNSPLFSQLSNTESIEQFSFKVTGLLQWRGEERARGGLGLMPSDNGVFACVAKNDKGSQTRTLKLSVLYKPRFTGTPLKVAAALNAPSAILTCTVSAQPPATSVSWIGQNGQPIANVGRYVIQKSQDVAKRLLISSLTISNTITESDFGSYTCRATNSEGNASADIKLRKHSVPEQPDPVRILSSTWESMEMAWTPPFDGGFQQKLELEMMWAKQQVMRPLPITLKRYNITGLLPRTNYTLRLRGVNQLGPGPFSTRVRHLTDSVFIPRIEMIQLNLRSLTLIFGARPGFCVRVETSRDDGRSWKPYRECLAPESGSLRLVDRVATDSFRGFLCMARRPEVCSEPRVAEVVENIPDIPTQTIIVVACVCAVVILALVVVLLYFCCRRREPRKDFEANPPHTETRYYNDLHPLQCLIENEDQSSLSPSSRCTPLAIASIGRRRPQTMAVQYPSSGSPHNQSSNSIASGKPYAMVPPSGYHEAVPTSTAQDRYDGSVMSTSLGSKPQVFATSQSSKDPLRADNPSMELSMTPLPPDGRPMSPAMNGDSASMVSKPRKVIYEVVV